MNATRVSADLKRAPFGGGGSAAIASAVILSWLALPAVFALPNGDDYCRARFLPLVPGITGWTEGTSIAAYVHSSWTHWTGRWLSVLIESGSLSRINPTRHYPILLALVWATTYSSSVLGTRMLLGARSPWRASACLGLVFWAVALSTLPSPEDGFYWFTGAVEYLLPIGGCLMVIGGAVASRRSTGAARLAATCLTALGSLLIPGLHELSGVGLCIVLTGCWLATGDGWRKGAVAWGTPILALLLGLVPVVAAPGNAIRQGFFPTPSLGTAISLTFRQAVTWVPRWLLNGTVLIASGLASLSGWLPSMGGRQGGLQPLAAREWLLPGSVAVVVLLGFFAPALAMSLPAPGRTLDWISITFLLGWLVTLRLISRSLHDRMPSITVSGATFRMLSVGFALSMLATRNSRDVRGDLLGPGPQWHHAMSERFITLERAGPKDTVHVLEPNAKPELFFTLDVTPDINAWRNRCVSGYFQVGGVILDPGGTASAEGM